MSIEHHVCSGVVAFGKSKTGLRRSLALVWHSQSGWLASWYSVSAALVQCLSGMLLLKEKLSAWATSSLTDCGLEGRMATRPSMPVIVVKS